MDKSRRAAPGRCSAICPRCRPFGWRLPFRVESVATRLRRNDRGDGVDISDEDKALIADHLARGEPLPDRFRFTLFREPREAELIWPGKTHEVTRAVLPFQTIEQIDEPRAETGAQVCDLFHPAPERPRDLRPDDQRLPARRPLWTHQGFRRRPNPE